MSNGRSKWPPNPHQQRVKKHQVRRAVIRHLLEVIFIFTESPVRGRIPPSHQSEPSGLNFAHCAWRNPPSSVSPDVSISRFILGGCRGNHNPAFLECSWVTHPGLGPCFQALKDSVLKENHHFLLLGLAPFVLKRNMVVFRLVGSSLFVPGGVNLRFLGRVKERFTRFAFNLETAQCNCCHSALVHLPTSRVFLGVHPRVPMVSTEWQCQEVCIIIKSFRMKCERACRFFRKSSNSHVGCQHH